MITFKDFLQEATVPTKRRGLEHLQYMKPTEFILFVRELQKRFPSGMLTNIAINVKVDGMAFRFGRDAEGRSFVETSYSGPVFEPGRFVAFAQQRGDPGMITRAQKIEEIFSKVVNSNLMSAVPRDRKVVCEVLYNPLGQITGSGAIKFSQVAYDRSKLGHIMTLVPRDILVSSTGEKAPDAKEVTRALVDLSTPDIKIVVTRLIHEPIDISTTINAVQTLTPNAIEVLRSRKKSDEQAKQLLTQTIQIMKNHLADIILHHKGFQGKNILGDQIEGLALEFGEYEVKITTPEMKQGVAQRRELNK